MSASRSAEDAKEAETLSTAKTPMRASSSASVEEEVAPTTNNNDPGSTSHLPFRQNTMMLISVASAISGALFGYDTGVVSGAIENVEATLGLSTAMGSLAVAITPAAACVFSLVAAPANVKFGRKPTLCVAAMLYTAGAIIVGAAIDFWSLLSGRACLGIAVGLGSMTVPIFVSEVAPPSMRGRMVTLYDMMIVVGQLIAGGVNGGLQYLGRGSWRVSMALAALPSLAQLALLVTLPESPRWLVAAGKLDEAEAALCKLRRVSTYAVPRDDVKQELETIKAVVEKEERAAKQGTISKEEEEAETSFTTKQKDPWVASVSTRPRRRALLVGCMIMTIQAATGINAVMYFGASIARSVGLTQRTSVWAAAVFDAAQLCGVIVSISRMDVDGRRALALRSTSGCVITLAAMIVFAALHISDGVIGATVAYLFVFGSGLSGVAWTVNGEVHPLATRSHAQSIAVASNWFANFLVSIYFASAEEARGPALALSPFLVFTILGLFWIYAYLPETKGVSLEALEKRFEKPLGETGLCCTSKEENQRSTKLGGDEDAVRNGDDPVFSTEESTPSNTAAAAESGGASGMSSAEAAAGSGFVEIELV